MRFLRSIARPHIARRVIAASKMVSNGISTRAFQSSQPHPLNVLIPLYHDFNTFDVNGPIEVLSQANRVSEINHFKITIAAAEELTTSIELARMARDISLTEAIKRVSDWDVLLVRGGTEPVILSMIQKWNETKSSQKDTADGANEVMRLIDGYMSTDPSRLTFTVCTGSLFLGASGRLAGRTATTHWASIPTLKKICGSLHSGTLGSSLVSRFVSSVRRILANEFHM